jgi:hypothetical protein
MDDAIPNPLQDDFLKGEMQGRMQGQTKRSPVLPEPVQRKSMNVLPREFKARAARDLC